MKRQHLNTGFALAVLAGAALVACGGGGSDAVSVAGLADMPTMNALAFSNPSGIEAGVVSMTQVSETRIGRTVYEYVYRVGVRNGSQPQTGVVAELRGAGQGTTIVSASANVGDLAAGASADSAGTITIRQDRSYPFDTRALNWHVSGNYTNAPDAIRMVWFGITNWQYQFGTKGILLDGETRNSGSTPNAASVTKALNTLNRAGTIDLILVGHDHPDHSVQTPQWALQTGKPVYAPATVCAKMVAYGLPASQCTTLLGGETIPVDDFTSVRVVRWVHSVDCGELSNGTGGPETFGFLFTTQSKQRDRVLNFFASDSGAGNTDLTTPRVANGITYGSPIDNLKAAMASAGLKRLDVWQGGPESRVVNQAKYMVPVFHVGTFMPHHLDARANTQSSFSLTYGMHYPYNPNDQPLLNAYLNTQGVPQAYPTNYFDAWTYGPDGVTKIGNAAQKADYGLPADGPGPGVQGPNPRAGDLECAGDGDAPVLPAPI